MKQPADIEVKVQVDKSALVAIEQAIAAIHEAATDHLMNTFGHQVPWTAEWDASSQASVELIEEFMRATQPRYVAIVSKSDHPKIAEHAPELKRRCNIVELRPSEYAAPGKIMLILAPEERA